MKKRFLPVLFLLFALLPEYIAPVLAVIFFAFAIRFDGKFTLSNTQKAFITFFTYMIIGLFYAEKPVSGLAGMAVWLLAFCANIAVTCQIKDKDSLDKLIFFTSLSSGIAGLIGIVQMLLYHYGALIYKPLRGMFNPFWHLLDTAVAKFATETLLPDSILAHFQRTEFIYIPQRASGTFTNPVFYAIFLVITAPLAAYCMFFAKTRTKRIIGFLCFVCSVAGIAVSYSRGPYLAVAVAFMCLFFYGKKYFIRLLLMAGAILGVLLVTSSGVFRRLLTIFSSDDISINTRSDIWKACFEMLDGHLLFGYGTGTANIGDQLRDVYAIDQPHAHNLLLEVLLENGIIGALLMIAFFVIFLIKTIRLLRRGSFCKNIAVTCIASFAGFCICSLTDYPVYGIKPLFYFMMIVSLVDAVYSFPDNSVDIPYTKTQKELTYER